MKKIISLLLALVISMMCALPSLAAKSVKFTVSNSEVFAGDEFTVDIFISDYSLLKSATLLVEYDKKSMQFLDLNVGAIVTAGSNAVSFKNVNNSDKSYVQIDYNDSSASLSSAGKFLSLTFVANDTAVGETDVKLSVNGNKVTTQSGSVTPEFKNGKINIINNNPVSDSKTEPSSEERSSLSDPTASESSANPQNTAQNATESSSQITTDSSSDNKNKEKSNKGLVIAAVIITFVVIWAVLFETKGNNKKRKNKKKKRKTRR